MLIMKTFSSYLSLLCVYWSRRAATGKSRGGLFRKGGSSDAVALERISVCVCVCISLFPAWVHCVLMHILVCMCVC